MDWDKLRDTIRKAVHFLDNVIEVNKYPLPEIAETTLATRKIGLGLMGFADMLLYLGIPYNSEQGVTMGNEIMEMINRTGHEASAQLAQERGAFPLFGESIYRDGTPLRNAIVTTIAPTERCPLLPMSPRVEPVFAYAYIRK